MRIHRVSGKSLRDALERARHLHGSQAVVLSHESHGGLVTVAVTTSEIERVVPPPADSAPRPEPGFADVERRLARFGATQALIGRLRARIENDGARGPFAIDAAAELLEGWVPIAPSPKLGGVMPVIALIGPTGVGKTTTTAKLATKLARGGRRVALVSTDVERAASLGLLSSRARALGATLDLAANERALAKAIEQNRGKDVVLVDTVGHSPRDGEMIAGLAHLLRGAADLARLTSYLVLSATTARASLDLACEAFASAHSVGLVLTKLDESATPACGLELAHDRSLPLAFLCDGPSVEAHLARPKPAHIADLFLRGRLE